MARPITNPKDRFREKYSDDPIKGCWLWLAYVDGDGYGKFRLGGQVLTAHHAVALSWTDSRRLRTGPSLPDEAVRQS
jgi:hypothetical protein